MKGGPQIVKSKKVVYAISLIIFAALLAVFFLPLKDSKILTACVLTVLTAVTLFFIRRRATASVSKKEVLMLSAILGILSVVLVQMSGSFFGFYENPYSITSKLILNTVFPLAVIIVTTEIIRNVMLAQNNRFVSFMAFLSCLIAETLTFSNVAGITTFNRFMDLVGLTLFPAISSNIYYHFSSRRYGAFPNIVFRLITTLYIYFIPTETAMSDAVLSIIKLVLPMIMYALVSALFEKKKKKVRQKGKKLSTFTSILSSAAIVAIAMLISCQFRFGAIVIATDSMTGEINKGDMIIYERYDGQNIEEGQVIVFTKGESLIIHRVVRIDRVGKEVRYYTKGDANNGEDAGYRIESDIVGLTDIKLPGVGYPTLWLREMIQGSK